MGLLAVNQPTHTRTGCSLANVAWGPAAAERAGIALLVLLMNRLRSRDWPLADAEVSELLLEPLRQLADAAKLQSTHNRGPLRERLTAFRRATH